MHHRNILVVGGAGYIGAHMVDYLFENGYTPIVLDNLSAGHQSAVGKAKLIIGDMADTALLDKLFASYQFLAVMHFASFIQVGESVIFPEKYYQNNVANSLNLLQAMLKWNVKKFIFSSTAALYGEPLYTPIDEKHPLNPINPYGQSKWMLEKILQDYARAYDLRFIALRYFNAAGRKPHSHLYECHEPETHLIPLILQTAMGKREAIHIYGNDYPTPDGTCIRDYIHVLDLCSAHLLALEALCNGATSCAYNLGTNEGYSVKQVIEVAKKITQCPIPVITGPRRVGDPAVLVADATSALQALNWQPRHSDINTIIADVWEGMIQH